MFGTVKGMSPRVQMVAVVVVCALAAAGGAVGVTLATRDNPQQPNVEKGKPPIPKTLPGVAGRQIEAAFATWPHGTINAMQKLALSYPSAKRGTAAAHASALVQLYRGIALVWDGYDNDAETALEAAKHQGWNTPTEIQADNLLHPNYFTEGYPQFIPVPASGPLERGARLQAAGHQHSAEAVYAAYAKAHPESDQAQVAAAVGLFDMDNINTSFGALGPLTATFPQSQVVRYYLGLLLVWTDQPAKALTQFKNTVKLGATTQYGKTATAFIGQLQTAAAATTTTGS